MLLSARSDKSAAGVIMRQGADTADPGPGAGVTPAPGYHAPLSCALAIAPTLLYRAC